MRYMKAVLPKTVYLRDYQISDYLIEKVDLEFNLEEEFTLVKSRLVVQMNPASANPASDLVLQGEALDLVSLALDNNALDKTQFNVSDRDLTIFNVPKNFIVDIQTRIKPQKNTALSGLYKSSGNFCTQCEAHGFRRITYFLDRPDVMSRYSTTIIADEKKYPILLSNGNLMASGKSEQGKHWVRWEDPFKKPSYLFALVAGDLEFI